MKNKLPVADKKELLLQYLPQCYGIVTVACRKAGVGRTAYYEYLKNDAAFAAKIKTIEESFLDYVETRLWDLIQTGDRTAIIFYLKAKGKSRSYH